MPEPSSFDGFHSVYPVPSSRLPSPSPPVVVTFELKSLQKTTVVKQQVHSIALHTAEGGKHLTQWCQNILDLHTKKVTNPRTPCCCGCPYCRFITYHPSKNALTDTLILFRDTPPPPDRVMYTRRMPSVESLMEAWADGAHDEPSANQLEELAKQIVQWDNTAHCAHGLDIPLEDYSRVACALMDIPVKAAVNMATANTTTTTEVDRKTTRSVVEGLHLLFSVYAEFKNSQHFGKMTV